MTRAMIEHLSTRSANLPPTVRDELAYHYNREGPKEHGWLELATRRARAHSSRWRSARAARAAAPTATAAIVTDSGRRCEAC